MTTSRIDRDQFLRGFRALQAVYEARSAISQVAQKHGHGDFDLGSNPAAHELQMQLEERCRDREDDDGTQWPIGDGVSLIECGLMTIGTVHDERGNTLDLPDGEAVWAYWEATKTGPFREPQP